MLAEVEAALRGGAGLVQYRDKGDDQDRLRAEAAALRALCRAHDALFVINDDPVLARAVAADGVHLGRDDGDWAAARDYLGGAYRIGVSCYGDIARAEAAEAAGMDYVAFGSVFASPSKPQAPRVSLETLAEARRRLSLPMVAIGGIRPDNVAELAAVGVDAVAVISALFDAPDVEQTARAFVSAFK